MELKQLEYFRAIVEEGTVSGAARVLHMTQPPLSYQMKMLEDELQVQLYLRGTKKITLTDAGKVLYSRACSLLTMTDITKREVVKASQAATIHIGMTPSTVSRMADYLARFSRKHPEIHFDVHEGSTFTLKDELENGMVDITTVRTPVLLKGCYTKPLIREQLRAFVHPDSLKPGQTSIALKDLSGQRLILSHRYRQYILSAFEKENYPCDIYCECSDARTALTFAERGLGVAILPASMKELSQKICTCEITGADLMTEILLAWRQERLQAEVQNFIDEM